MLDKAATTAYSSGPPRGNKTERSTRFCPTVCEVSSPKKTVEGSYFISSLVLLTIPPSETARSRYIPGCIRVVVLTGNTPPV